MGGCVDRRMTILSDPPGALVRVNGYDLGAAPVDVPSDKFVYYGHYEIELIKDNYEPLRVRQAVPPPWYERFPLDFISENLVPWRIKDHRIYSYTLAPPQPMVSEQVLQNAEAFRGQAP